MSQLAITPPFQAPQHRRNVGQQLSQPRQLYVATEPTLLEKIARIFCCCCYKPEMTPPPTDNLSLDFFGFEVEGSGRNQHLVIRPPRRKEILTELPETVQREDLSETPELHSPLSLRNKPEDTRLDSMPSFGEELSPSTQITPCSPKMPKDPSLDSFSEYSNVESPKDKFSFGEGMSPSTQVTPSSPSMPKDTSMDSLTEESHLESQFQFNEGTLIALRVKESTS